MYPLGSSGATKHPTELLKSFRPAKSLLDLRVKMVMFHSYVRWSKRSCNKQSPGTRPRRIVDVPNSHWLHWFKSRVVWNYNPKITTGKLVNDDIPYSGPNLFLPKGHSWEEWLSMDFCNKTWPAIFPASLDPGCAIFWRKTDRTQWGNSKRLSTKWRSCQDWFLPLSLSLSPSLSLAICELPRLSLLIVCMKREYAKIGKIWSPR